MGPVSAGIGHLRNCGVGLALVKFFRYDGLIAGIAGHGPADTNTSTNTNTDTDTSLWAGKCRNQSCFHDSRIFDGHIAGAVDFGRFAGVRVGVDSETSIA